MDYSKCSTSTHLFTLVRLHSIPWFPFALLVGDLASVNGIHQWPVIRRWTTIFDLSTSISIVGHVLVAICVEEFPAWWDSTYATSLIVLAFMRFQLLWFDSSVCQISSAIMEILIHCISSAIMEILIYCIFSSTLEILIYCILYMAMTTHVTFCISCLFVSIVLLCIWNCYI